MLQGRPANWALDNQIRKVTCDHSRLTPTLKLAIDFPNKYSHLSAREQSFHFVTINF